MLYYLKYFGTWVFFMALIAGIALLVPKMAKALDKKFKKIKEERQNKYGIANLSDEAILPENMLENTAEAPETPTESNTVSAAETHNTAEK